MMKNLAVSFATLLILYSGSVYAASKDLVLLDVQPFSVERVNVAPASSFKHKSASGDELEDCMNNPDNADQDYIERLGNCFCLATDNASDGC